MEEQLEALSLLTMQLHVMHRALVMNQGGAAVHTCEMVLVPFHRRKQSFAARQMAAADQTTYLQLPQVAIHGGQSHRLGSLAQEGMQILAGELPVGQLQLEGSARDLLGDAQLRAPYLGE